MKIVDNYINNLYVTEEINNTLLEIDFKSIVNKFKSKDDVVSFGKKLKTSVDLKSPEKTMKMVKRLTKNVKVDLSSVDKLLSKSDKDFLKRKMLCKQILKNSLSGASEKSIEAASTFLSFSSIIQKKDEQVLPNVKLRNDIKKFVVLTRKFQNEYDDDEKPKKGQIAIDSVPDYAIGIALVITMAVIIGGLGHFSTILAGGIMVALNSPIAAGVGIASLIVFVFAGILGAIVTFASK